MKKVQSTCNYCALDCNIDFYVENERIVKVLPTKGYPVNDGFCCIKGLSLDKQQTVVKTSPCPKIRQPDKTMKEVSWEEGFRHVADKLKELQKTYGTESVAGISTGQLTVEEFALYGHVMRNYLKANVDGNTRLCMATAAVAHKQSYGFDAPGFTLEDLELSDRIVFVGANPIVSHPIIWKRVRLNPDKKIIVIDPRKSETAVNADYWYQLKCRGDLYLFYTLAGVLIEKGWVDQEYIETHTEGYEDFKEFVKAFPLESSEEQTGLAPEQILELAGLIHEGKRVSFWWTMGVNQGYEAVRTAQAIINLALMTGNIGRPGTGANSITGQCNAMGSRIFSNTTALYAGGDFNNPKRRQRVAEALGVEEAVLAEKPTASYNQIIEGINDGRIKGLWILCTNPRHSWINNQTFASAAKKLELLVVQDIYDTTESAEECTVFFPAVPGIKKEGTLINMERRLSALRPCLKKNKNELTDYEIILGVGKALGMGELLKGWETPRDCFELMKECSRGMPCDITGVTWEMLENSKGVQWPFPEGETLLENQRRLYEDGNYYTPGKKANFKFEAPMENPFPLTEEYPYLLNTGRGSVGQWHTQTRTKEVRFICDVTARRAYLFMNPLTAATYELEENDQILVHSANGQEAGFQVRLSDQVREKELYAPMHYIECNKLTLSVYDPYSKEPSYKAAPVWFEKAKGGTAIETNKN